MPAAEFNEEALIQQAQAGDLQAFNRLVYHYQSLTYNVAYRILSDADAAADATQDAFLSAYKALDSFRGGSFKAWILRIVTNACYDELRRKKRQPTSSLDALLVQSGTHEVFVDRTENPESYALRQDLGQIIQAGLETLPEDQRATVVLADIQGLHYKEIAEITGVELGTVKSRLSRGRARLRDFLRQQEELLPHRYRLRGD
ncbi:MAG: sigma-70 family RNA polymerase sigma factor [Anaerolineae bacterium]